jgi:hypothetical protein
MININCILTAVLTHITDNQHTCNACRIYYITTYPQVSSQTYPCATDWDKYHCNDEEKIWMVFAMRGLVS